LGKIGVGWAFLRSETRESEEEGDEMTKERNGDAGLYAKPLFQVL
jgi:hypothetical protein